MHDVLKNPTRSRAQNDRVASRAAEEATLVARQTAQLRQELSTALPEPLPCKSLLRLDVLVIDRHAGRSRVDVQKYAHNDADTSTRGYGDNCVGERGGMWGRRRVVTTRGSR